MESLLKKPKRSSTCDADVELRLRPAFSDIDSFMALVEHFIETMPEYAPERWNLVEPINKPFDLTELINKVNNLIY
mgnify:CR=1 FL=1